MAVEMVSNGGARLGASMMSVPWAEAGVGHDAAGAGAGMGKTWHPLSALTSLPRVWPICCYVLYPNARAWVSTGSCRCSAAHPPCHTPQALMAAEMSSSTAQGLGWGISALHKHTELMPRGHNNNNNHKPHRQHRGGPGMITAGSWRRVFRPGRRGAGSPAGTGVPGRQSAAPHPPALHLCPPAPEPSNFQSVTLSSVLLHLSA